MAMGGVDNTVSKKIAVFNERKSWLEQFKEKQQAYTNKLITTNKDTDSSSDSKTDHKFDSTRDTEFV